VSAVGPGRSRCDRCAAAGQRGTAETTSAPYWDPDYRICAPCLAAVLFLVDATGTRPEPAGDGWTSPTHPAHTGAPHYLWNPDKRGLAAQIADRGGAAWPAEAPAVPATSDHPSRAADGVLSDQSGGAA
jgi:hypothetical protein